MRELFRDFLNKLFFRNESKPVPIRIEWRTFGVFDDGNLEPAIESIKELGYTVKSISYDNRRTEILASREVL